MTAPIPKSWTAPCSHSHFGGTDPEALLLIEARQTNPSRCLAWHYAIARFTDQQLWVRHKGKEVFTAP